jgi:hypothetical protein
LLTVGYGSRKCAKNNSDPGQYKNVGKVKYACVNWSDLNRDEVGDQTATRHSVQKIAEPTRQDERKAKKSSDVDLSTPHQVNTEDQQPDPNTSGENHSAKLVGEKGSEAQE